MLTVWRALERLIRNPQTIGVKVKTASPISMGDMNAQKAIVDSHLRRFQNGTERALATRAISMLTAVLSGVRGRGTGVRGQGTGVRSERADPWPLAPVPRPLLSYAASDLLSSS